MRFPPGKLPEVIDACERDGLHFATIRHARAGEDRIFELGISANSHAALRRVFQTRPFDQMPGLKQRYFFVPSYSKRDDPERGVGSLRIEQGNEGRNIQVEMPKMLIANLLWFYEMEALEPAKHLHSRPSVEK
ncbi:MAG: hypothetical protein ACTHLN_01775 [Tepidisphaeraceae bacterium]